MKPSELVTEGAGSPPGPTLGLPLWAKFCGPMRERRSLAKEGPSKEDRPVEFHAVTECLKPVRQP